MGPFSLGGRGEQGRGLGWAADVLAQMQIGSPTIGVFISPVFDDFFTRFPEMSRQFFSGTERSLVLVQTLLCFLTHDPPMKEKCLITMGERFHSGTGPRWLSVQGAGRLFGALGLFRDWHGSAVGHVQLCAKGGLVCHCRCLVEEPVKGCIQRGAEPRMAMVLF